MKNIIKVNMETIEEDFEFLMNSYANQKGCKLESIGAVDYCEYEIVEPYRNYDLRFEIAGSIKNEEDRIECIKLERVHMQYDFISEKMYGFFMITSYTCNGLLEDGMFEVYMSEKSREII